MGTRGLVYEPEPAVLGAFFSSARVHSINTTNQAKLASFASRRGVNTGFCEAASGWGDLTAAKGTVPTRDYGIAATPPTQPAASNRPARTLRGMGWIGSRAPTAGTVAAQVIADALVRRLSPIS